MPVPTPVQTAQAHEHYPRMVLGSQLVVTLWVLAILLTGLLGAADGLSHAQVVEATAAFIAIGAALGTPGIYAGRRLKGHFLRKSLGLALMWWVLFSLPAAVAFTLAVLHGPQMNH